MKTNYLLLGLTAALLFSHSSAQAADISAIREEVIETCKKITTDPTSRNIRAFNNIFKELDHGTVHACDCSKEILTAIQAVVSSDAKIKLEDLPALYTCIPKLGIQLSQEITIKILAAIAKRLESYGKGAALYWNGLRETLSDCSGRMYLSEALQDSMAELIRLAESHPKARLSKKIQELRATFDMYLAEAVGEI